MDSQSMRGIIPGVPIKASYLISRPNSTGNLSTNFLRMKKNLNCITLKTKTIQK